MGMPDIHSGYGFAIGNVAAFDMDDPNAVVSPGGVGNSYYSVFVIAILFVSEKLEPDILASFFDFLDIFLELAYGQVFSSLFSGRLPGGLNGMRSICLLLL